VHFGRVMAARFLDILLLARLQPKIAMGACQWSGVAMVIASTSFFSSTAKVLI